MIKIELNSEKVISREPAKILIYENNKLFATVIAATEPELGADSHYYNVVKLKIIKNNFPFSVIKP